MKEPWHKLVGAEINGVVIKAGVLGQAVANAERDLIKRNVKGETARRSEMIYLVAKHLVLLSGGKMKHANQ
jgi:hypothetical protein